MYGRRILFNIHIPLKGNARTSGEQRRKEKDNIFGEGSRAPVAMVFLVKNPNDPIKGKIFFHTVEDYLTREQKLNEVSKFGSISNKTMTWDRIIPNKHGDWLNQKDDSFQRYYSIFDKNGENCIFNANSVGVCTNRDTWVYSSSKVDLENNLSRTVIAYNKAIDLVNGGEEVQKVIAETKMIFLGQMALKRNLSNFRNNLLIAIRNFVLCIDRSLNKYCIMTKIQFSLKDQVDGTKFSQMKYQKSSYFCNRCWKQRVFMPSIKRIT